MPKTISLREWISPLFSQALLLGLLALVLNGCDVATRDEQDDAFSPSGLSAYNYSTEGIQEFHLDGTWGSNVGVGAGGGAVCCVSVPKKRQPGLAVTLEWRRSDCGIPRSPQCTIENAGKWPEKSFKRVIPIQPYDTANDVQVMFLPEDEIRIYVTGLSPSHPEHPAHIGRARPLSSDDLKRIFGK